MDMKKILQTMDNAGKKTSPGPDTEMKQFVSIISEGKGSSNRSTQAERIVTQHYSKVEQQVVEQKNPALSINRYFKEVEQELAENRQVQESFRTAKINRLAERAVKEVGGNHGHFSSLRTHVSRTSTPPDNIIALAKSGARIDNNRRKKLYREETDTVDTVTMDIPLFIRLLEYSKEDAKTDMDLHHVAERAIALAKKGTLTMDHYDEIIHNAVGVDEADKHSFVGRIQRKNELKKKVDSSHKAWGAAQKTGDKQKASKAFRDHERYANLERPGTWTKSKDDSVEEDTDPCWKDYKQVGMKKKNGKSVPNCVPKK